ncbi:MAG: ArsR/SmtB family transcription factor [Promethearchaeota archaeon]
MNEIKIVMIDFIKVLSDQTRLDILDLLKKEEAKTSKDIQDALGKSQSTISQQLKILYTSNLVDYEKKENTKYYYIKNEEIFDLLSTIKAFVIKINKEKLKDIADIDIIDTLF